MNPQWQRWKNIMKFYPFEEKRLAKWEPPYIVQPKYDGVRCRAVPIIAGGYILLSSEENIIFSVPHINEAVKVQGPPGKELDGELYCHGMSFEQIISITSRTKNLHPDYERMQYHVFDFVDEVETPQMDRIISLAEIQSSNPLYKAPFWAVSSLEGIMEVYNELIVMGYEGIIVRNAFAPYVKKRSIYGMKFKPKQEDDYVILGSEEECDKHGTPKNRLGALICDSGDGNTFNVGSGFTDNHRDGLWRNRESLPGMVVRVKYQHITTGRKVPRFGVFDKKKNLNLLTEVLK